MADFSDNFNRADNDSLGSDWTEVVGDTDIVSNQMSFRTTGWDPIAVVHNTACSTVNQYMKVTFPSPAGYPVFILRYTNSSSHYYGIAFETLNSADAIWKHYSSTSEIGAPATTIASGDVGSFTAGDSLGITITGTGNDTVIRLWKNPTANTPISASEWDSGDTSPEVTFTTDPGTNAVDSGSYLGIHGAQSTAGTLVFDNFYGGDIPTGGASIPLSNPFSRPFSQAFGRGGF